MKKDLFTASPVKANADSLNEITKDTICQKLSSIIYQIGEQININFAQEIEKIRTIKTSIIDPTLFYYYFRLKEAIQSEALDQILDTISLLVQHTKVASREPNTKYPIVSSVLEQEWEKELFINKTRKDIISEFGIKNGFEVIRPVFLEEMTNQESNIKAALEILEETDDIHKYVATNYLNAIKVFDGTIRGFSYQAAYGNIYIRIPQNNIDNTLYYLEHIVHECAHQYLFALQIFDPVVLNDVSELYDAPIRIQKRPMNGIFHACFVLARMVRCFRKAEHMLENSTYSEFINRIDNWFNSSYRTVNEYAKLTENGQRVFSSLKACAYD